MSLMTMKAILQFFVFVALFGCSLPRNESNASLTVVPGLGIKNVLEIGMKLSDIRKANPDILIDREVGDDEVRRAIVPSLGASLSSSAKDATVSRLYFIVDMRTYVSNSLPVGFQIFRGSLSCGLSFSEVGVRREQVTGVFGVPSNTVDQSSIPLNQRRDGEEKLGRFLNKGESVSWRSAKEVELLIYPAQGIVFKLIHNIVYAFDIFRPWPVEQD
jgi:hypothetical protein